MNSLNLLKKFYKTFLKYKKFTFIFFLILFLIYPVIYRYYHSKVQYYNFTLEFDNILKYQDRLLSINFDVMTYSAERDVEQTIENLSIYNDSISVKCKPLRYRIECSAKYKILRDKENNYTAILINNTLNDFYYSFMEEYKQKIQDDIKINESKAERLNNDMNRNIEMMNEYDQNAQDFINSMFLFERTYLSTIEEINKKIRNYKKLLTRIDHNIDIFYSKNTIERNLVNQHYNYFANLGIIIIGFAMYVFGTLMVIS